MSPAPTARGIPNAAPKSTAKSSRCGRRIATSIPTESRRRIQRVSLRRVSPEKRDATGLKGRGPVETRGHHDVPNSPSSERPSAGCASAEPTSIRSEARHLTRHERMRPSHGTPHRQEKQLAFSILQNFRSIVPRHSSSFALSDHHPTRLKSQHQNPEGFTPARIDFQRYIWRVVLSGRCAGLRLDQRLQRFREFRSRRESLFGIL